MIGADVSSPSSSFLYFFLQSVIKDSFWTTSAVLAKVAVKRGSTTKTRLFRCPLNERRWEEVATVDAEDIREIFPLVNSTSGEEDGILIFHSKKVQDPDGRAPVFRYKFERVMLRFVHFFVFL